MPGTDPGESASVVLGELGEAPHHPFLAQLPARGPGADPTGRAGALLVDLALDLQPSGWRFTDHPGRDQFRARTFLRNDLDALAEAADGFTGDLVVPVPGPWSLLAAVELPRGERSVIDPGARRDVTESLAVGIETHLADVARLVPGASRTVLLEEPSLSAVLEGRLPTASGYGSLRAVDAAEVRQGLRTVVEAVCRSGATPVLRLAPDGPFALAREAGAAGVAVDVTHVEDAGWESLATGIEAGVTLWAGVVPVDRRPPVGDVVRVLEQRWRRLGLVLPSLADVVVTPVGGLQRLDPATVRSFLGRLREVQDATTEVAQG